jgi:hypothetical protein
MRYRVIRAKSLGNADGRRWSADERRRAVQVRAGVRVVPDAFQIICANLRSICVHLRFKALGPGYSLLTQFQVV